MRVTTSPNSAVMLTEKFEPVTMIFVPPVTGPLVVLNDTIPGINGGVVGVAEAVGLGRTGVDVEEAIAVMLGRGLGVGVKVPVAEFVGLDVGSAVFVPVIDGVPVSMLLGVLDGVAL